MEGIHTRTRAHAHTKYSLLQYSYARRELIPKALMLVNSRTLSKHLHIHSIKYFGFVQKKVHVRLFDISFYLFMTQPKLYRLKHKILTKDHPYLYGVIFFGV